MSGGLILTQLFRSDFYVVTSDPHSPVGLPKGVAEAVLRQSFYKWTPQNQVLAKEKTVPEAVTETEVETCSVEAQPAISKVEEISQRNFSSSEGYNGAIYDNYSWSQTINEIDINLKVPSNVTTKNLSINIVPSKISVKLKDSGAVLLEGELCNKCKHTDAIWSLDKNKLEIHLEKASEIWWDCLVQGEAKLDLTKIDCSRPYEELSEEAQAKIQELTWNQERKRLGLPTSEELHMQEKLKKSWNAEGSPFKGSYDPNAVIFN